MLTAALELDPGANQEILHGAGDEHFARGGERGHTCRDVHRQATYIELAYVDFTGVDARSNLEAKGRGRLCDRKRAAHRFPWAVEGG